MFSTVGNGPTQMGGSVLSAGDWVYQESNVARLCELIMCFHHAVHNPENLDESGRINWNLVDADIQLDAGEDVPEEWYGIYSDLAVAYGFRQQ